MKYLIQELRNNKKFIEYSTNIKNKISPIELSGLTDVGKAQIISATAEENKRPILIITYNEIKAKKLLNDIKYLEQRMLIYKVWNSIRNLKKYKLQELIDDVVNSSKKLSDV